jgi:DNA polymerase
VTLAAADVAAAAAGAAGWGELADAVSRCTACAELVASRTRVVPGILPDHRADVLLVGEAPGAQEDEAGVPFVGRSGVLLDRLLAEAGLSRDRVAVANVLKCRPPANRKPRRLEVAHCRPWLARQLDLADPQVVVALGGTAAEWFFGPSARIAALRESEQHFAGRRVVVTYHPSAAIRFGPNGSPLAALRTDLAEAARIVAGTRPGPA